MSPEALVARAAALGYDALGITDAADLGGVVRFALACRRHGVRPLVGLELAVRHGGDASPRPIALLARTAAGYRALCALVTRARVGPLGDRSSENSERTGGAPARGWPWVSWEDVAALAGGGRDLVMLTGPTNGPLAHRARTRGRTGASALLAEYREAFGDALAVEVHLHYAGPTEEAIAGRLVRTAEAVGVRWAVAGDVRYIDAAGRQALDVLLALRHNTTVDDAEARGLLLPNNEWALHAPRVVAERWTGREEGVAATRDIAALCDFSLAWARPPLPHPPVPPGETADSWLRRHVDAGARERWGAETGVGAGAPDIDVVVEAGRREELLAYVYRTHGPERTAPACVVQTYSASTAVQDVCRAYGVPSATAHALSKSLRGVSPARALRHSGAGSPPNTGST